MPLAILAVFALLAIACCFEGAETSMFTVSDVRIQTLIRGGNAQAQLVARLKQNVSRLLGTLLLGQTVCDIAAASLSTLIAHDIGGDFGVAIETGALTIIVLIFVNLIPKSHAAHHAERWALASARPVYILTLVLGPVVAMLDRFASLFVKTDGMKTLVTEEEIRTMTRMGVKAGAVERGEKELIERVFLFNDITASDVLTPREIMFTLDGDRSVGDVLAEINSEGYSRYPVFEGTTDNIIGIVHIKDLLSRMIDRESMDRLKVRDCMTPPVFVNEKLLIDDLFRDLKRQRVHMAIVTSDSKTVVGLLTLEDLIEELVGEIADESDIDEYVIKRIDKHTIMVHGDKDIPDINRFFNTRIEEGDSRTIGRLVTAKAGRIPKQGQPVLIASDVMAVVEQVSRGRILKVRLIKSVNGAVGPQQ